jgi:hypothetical protein
VIAGTHPHHLIAFIGVKGTLWALQIDYSVDNEAAVMELISTEQIMEKLFKEDC